MTPRFRQLVVGAVLAFVAQHVLADFTCKAQSNGWVAPACQSPEVRRLVDQVTAASESLGCDARQRLELKAIQSAWGREQAACRLHDDGAHCTQASLKAELRYLRETRRCDVNARPVRASSPDASYVALHPNTYRDAQVSVTGQMFVDDCKPGARSTSGSVREGETGPALPVEFASLPDEQRAFLCTKQPFSSWGGVVRLRDDGRPYLFLTDVLGVELR